MYIPILVLAVYSFTDAANIGAIHAFSMHNYVTLFTTPELINMIIGSVLLAVGSAVLATILGTTGAIGAFYSKGKVKGAMSVLNQVPVVNADVVTGFSKNLSSNATIGLTIPTNTSSRYGLLLSANFSGVSTVMPVFTAIVLRTG